DQLEPANSAYSKSIAIKLRGALSISALERSLRAIVQRHEVLRTTFSVSNGLPKQHIQTEASFKLRLIDLSVLELVDQTSQALKLAEVEGRQPVNLTSDLPIRVALVRLNENEHHLLLTLHHIVSDAWSNGIFMRELNTLYADFVNGVEPSLP